MKSIVYKKTYNAPIIDRKEVLRYAGVKESNQETEALLDGCIAEARDILTYNACYRHFPISIDGDNIDLGFAETVSHSLALCLGGCDEIVIFCATVGTELDRLIKRRSLSSPAAAVMLEALGSERVEALCDELCADIASQTSAKLRPRFSPGYGDLSLELQRDIFSALDCPGKIGVTLGEKLFMTPSKSVTAIVGIETWSSV